MQSYDKENCANCEYALQKRSNLSNMFIFLIHVSSLFHSSFKKVQFLKYYKIESINYDRVLIFSSHNIIISHRNHFDDRNSFIIKLFWFFF